MIDENNIIKQIKNFQKSFEIRNQNTEYMKGFSEALAAVKEMIADEVKVELTSKDIKELEQEIKCSGMPMQTQALLVKLLNQKENLIEFDWIPCSERLPDYSGEVLITTRSSICGVGSFSGKFWTQYYAGGSIGVDVVAWHPLPPEYKMKRGYECAV